MKTSRGEHTESSRKRTGDTRIDARDAVEELVDRHGAKIYALAARLCPNAADAEDMVQNVFLTALRKWETFRGQADAGTWLYAIALRSCPKRGQRTQRLSELMPWTETSVTAAGADASDEASRAEAIESVQNAIAQLPEHLRVPLMMKEVLQIPIEDIARTLGLEPGTIKTRVHRGRLALRKAMLAGSERVRAPQPLYEKQVCLDLLKAKMSALDEGRDFAVPQAEMCARCRAVFRELDLVSDACAELSQGDMPAQVREAISRALAARDAERPSTPPRKGRRPVRPA